MRREDIDFFAVYSHHHWIHGELMNWRAVVKVSQREPENCAPIFRLYRSTDAHEIDLSAPVEKVPVRRSDGWEMEKKVRNLPEKHRDAIRWAYVKSHKPPTWACRSIGVSRAGLIELIHAGRAMLVNRTA